jgi:hypothetical protein
MRITGAAILVAALLVSACSGSSTTAPATTTPTTPTTTSPTTETFTSIVSPLGSASRTFTTATAGTISVTLATAGPPSNIVMQLGLGVPNPSGPGCGLATTVNVAASATPQITATGDAGSYCVAILDIGNAPKTGVSFVINILHP